MDEEIKNSEDFIRGLSRGEGFTLPEAYFENLERNILQKVEHLPQKKTKIFWLQTSHWVAVAASVIMVMGLFWFDPNTATENDINSQEIISHLQEEDIQLDVFCEVGLCSDLDQTEETNSALEEEILIEAEAELLMKEL
jgi:UDP-glucose 6-dehydrogenase